MAAPTPVPRVEHLRALRLSDLSELRANPRFLLKELIERGIAAYAYDIDRELFILEHDGVRRWLLGIETRALPWISWEFTNDKMIAKSILADGGLTVPRGRRFEFRAIDVALLVAMQIGFPVVVKPYAGARGENVHTGLTSLAAVEGAAEAISGRRGDVNFVLEKEVEGEEFRIFITRKGRYAAVQRRPAFVVGDGRSSIETLARLETERRMNPRKSCLGPIQIDAAVERWLARQGMNRHTIAPNGIAVPLMGHVDGTSAYVEEATEVIHPSLAEICHRAILLFPDVEYLGIDVVSTAPREAQRSNTYAILEVNNNAALGLHLAPGAGPGRNVAAEIADAIFPQTRTKNADLLPCLSLPTP
jgi:cyanophycin synthetase